MSQAPKKAYSIRLAGAPDDDTTVIFEPGAGEFVLKPGETFEIEVSGPDDERLEITHGSGYVAVWLGPAMSINIVDSAGNIVGLLGY